MYVRIRPSRQAPIVVSFYSVPQAISQVFGFHFHHPTPFPLPSKPIYFGSSKPVPEMDLSQSTLRLVACGICGSRISRKYGKKQRMRRGGPPRQHETAPADYINSSAPKWLAVLHRRKCMTLHMEEVGWKRSIEARRGGRYDSRLRNEI